jgi:hypothetical protein
MSFSLVACVSGELESLILTPRHKKREPPEGGSCVGLAQSPNPASTAIAFLIEAFAVDGNETEAEAASGER